MKIYELQALLDTLITEGNVDVEKAVVVRIGNAEDLEMAEIGRFNTFEIIGLDYTAGCNEEGEEILIIDCEATDNEMESECAGESDSEIGNDLRAKRKQQNIPTVSPCKAHIPKDWQNN